MSQWLSDVLILSRYTLVVSWLVRKKGPAHFFLFEVLDSLDDHTYHKWLSREQQAERTKNCLQVMRKKWSGIMAQIQAGIIMPSIATKVE